MFKYILLCLALVSVPVLSAEAPYWNKYSDTVAVVVDDGEITASVYCTLDENKLIWEFYPSIYLSYGMSDIELGNHRATIFSVSPVFGNIVSHTEAEWLYVALGVRDIPVKITPKFSHETTTIMLPNKGYDTVVKPILAKCAGY